MAAMLSHTVITIASYALGAGLFSALTLLLLTHWRGRVLGTAFVAACALNAAWLGLLALWPIYPSLPWQGILVAEALRDGAWLYLLARLLRATGDGRGHGAWLIGAVLLGPLAWIGWMLVTTLVPASPSPQQEGTAFIYGGMALSILGLMLLEQFCRNLTPERRWALKFLCFGLGLQFGYDLTLYAAGALYHRLDPTLWATRGAVFALAAPLLAVAAARNPEWSGNVYVSRRIVFHATALIATGAYLLIIAAGGYYIRDLGGTWGAFWQILFSAAAVTALVIALASGQARAQIKVFLLKNFHTYRYDYREEWSRLIERLYRGGDTSSAYERAIQALAEIIDSTGGALWIKREAVAAYAPVAQRGLSVPAEAIEPLESAFACFLLARHWIIEADGPRAQAERYNVPELPGWLQTLPRWWLVVPLAHAGELIGFVVLARPRAPHAIDWEDRDLLKAVSHQLAAYLAQHEAARTISQAHQFQTFNQLSTFLMHDLRNLLAHQSLLVENAAQHKHNPVFVDEMIITIKASVQRMKRLMAQLQSGREAGRTRPTPAADVIRQVVSACADRQPQPQFPPPASGAGQWRVLVDPQAFAMVLTHILHNAQDATGKDGTIRVMLDLDARAGRVLVDVIDNGCGMSPQFIRERLFTPFDTTKSARGMGIGAYQTRAFARDHQGDVEVESRLGAGTRFRIWLPLVAREEGGGS